MESITDVANGLATNPTSWLLALALAAIGFLYREKIQAHKEAIDRFREDAALHRETLLRVIPIAEKLTESVAILDRISMAKVKHED